MTWSRENSCLYRDKNSNPSVVQPVARRYTASTKTLTCSNIFTLHDGVLVTLSLIIFERYLPLNLGRVTAYPTFS
jgi:hypothetical protein